MSSTFSENLLNSTFVDAIQVIWHTFNAFLTDTAIFFNRNQRKVVISALENFPDSVYFSEFQWTLLKGFSLLLFVNLVLIFVAWKFYGQKICERFMKPATTKAIEELKASVSKLKLPKEHTPRI